MCTACEALHQVHALWLSSFMKCLFSCEMYSFVLWRHFCDNNLLQEEVGLCLLQRNGEIVHGFGRVLEV